jgi:hypothetical protein
MVMYNILPFCSLNTNGAAAAGVDNERIDHNGGMLRDDAILVVDDVTLHDEAIDATRTIGATDRRDNDATVVVDGNVVRRNARVVLRINMALALYYQYH